MVKGLESVQVKNFWNATLTKVRFDAELLGLNDSELVALMAAPRSGALLMKNGLEGTTYTSAPNVLSNSFFTTLKAETWQAYNATSGYMQYKAAGKSLYILSNDFVLLNDTSFKAVVDWFSADNNAFLNNFVQVWTKLMNIDRFDGPTGNVCWNTSVPINPAGPTVSTTTTGTGTNTNNGNMLIISLLFFIISLLI